MSAHLLLMTNDAQSSAWLSTKATVDTAEASEYHSQSVASQAQSEHLQEEASILDQKSKLDSEQAIQDSDRAKAHQESLAGEQAQAVELETQISSEQAFYEAEIQKANEETSAVATSTVKTESDGAATTLCEVIPFVDILCDVVGGLAAMGFESSAAKSSAQSALDYTAAATTKAQEDANAAQLEVLQAQEEEHTQVMTELQIQAQTEQMKAQEEEAQAQADYAQEEQEEAISQQEGIKANQEEQLVQEEQEQATSEMDKSLQEGLSALRDAIMTGVLAVLVSCFFTIRVVIAVVIPMAMAVLGFIPFVTSVATSTSRSSAFATSATSASSSSSCLYNLWMTLPTRQTSYFILHGGIFIATMSTWFCTKFQNLNNFDVRSQGGILLLFATYASLLQGFLLHAIPNLINIMKKKNGTTTSSASSTIINPLLLLQEVVYTIMTFLYITIHHLLKAMIHLVPLFIMEAIILWLLFGRCIVTFTLPLPWTPESLGIMLGVASLTYIVAFEITLFHNDDDSNDSNDNDSFIITKAPSSSSSLWIIPSSDSNSSDIANETNALLYNNMNNVAERVDTTLSTMSSYSYCSTSYHHHNIITTNNNNDNNNELISQSTGNSAKSIMVDSTTDDSPLLYCASQISSAASFMDNNNTNDVDNTNDVEQRGEIIDAHVVLSDEGYVGGRKAVERIPLLEQQEEQQYHYQHQLDGSKSPSLLKSSSYQSHVRIDMEDELELEEGGGEYDQHGHHHHFKRKTEETMPNKTNTSICQRVQSTINQYLNDLKLPFEILILTCMGVLLRGCIPILIQLLPRIMSSHEHFFLITGGVVVVIGIIVWYLVRSNNHHHGHIRLWTGDALR